MKSKYDKWLKDEIRIWEERGLVDSETLSKIRNYYELKAEGEPNKLGAILAVLGSILIGLGIILILAKNWGYFSRGGKVVISFIPFFIGSFLGMFAIKKELQGWIREAAAIVTTIGILTAIVMSGQIYHVLTDEWILFLFITLLTLPLIYVYEGVVTFAAYLVLGSVCLFLTESVELWIKTALAIMIIGASVPYAVKEYKKSKLSIQASWCSAFLALAGFAFITSLMNNEVLLRELYIIYFTLLIVLDALIYERKTPFSLRPFAVAGNIGLYMTLFIFTFRSFWRYVDTTKVGWGYMVIIWILLIAIASIMAWLRKEEKQFSRRLFLYLGAAVFTVVFRLLGLLEDETYIIITIFFNLLFIALAMMTLKKGLELTSIGRMNMGLLLLAAVIIARFFDSEFSFLTKGIAFILCGLICLFANLYLIKKRKKEEENG